MDSGSESRSLAFGVALYQINEVTKLGKTLDIHIEVPDDVSDESLRLAECRAREAAVLFLQQEGELSIREAAMELGLSYEGYLDLLAAKGLPASFGTADPGVMDAVRERLRQKALKRS